MFISPGVEVNAIEGETLRSNGNDREVRADFAIEAVLVHAKIGGRIPKSQEARCRLIVVSPHAIGQLVGLVA